MRLTSALSKLTPVALVLAAMAAAPALAEDAHKPTGGAPAAAQPAAPATADPATTQQAKQVLIESAAAIKAMKGVSAHARRATEMQGIDLATEGDVWFLRNAANAPASPFMIKGTMKHPAGVASAELLFNGTAVIWRDDTKKEVIEKPAMTPDQVQKAKTLRLQLFPMPFFDNEPYMNELKAQQIILGDPAQAAGIDCDVVRIINAANSETRLFIAKADRLPRRVEQISISGGRENKFILTLTDLKPAEVKPAEFRIDLPEGYQKKVEEPVKPITPPVPTPQQPQQPTMPKGGLEVGAPAPAWSLKADGGSASETLAAQKGKAVVLGFWGPIFADSKNVLGVMEETRKGYADKGVSFFGVACRHTGPGAMENARAMFKESGAAFPMLIEGDTSAGEYKVRGFPSIAVIDSSGKVAAFFENAPTPDALKAAVDRAMIAEEK